MVISVDHDVDAQPALRIEGFGGLAGDHRSRSEVSHAGQKWGSFFSWDWTRGAWKRDD
jgi:hypothetical protein